MALNETDKIITKSYARSRIVGGTSPLTTIPIEFEEICCVCNKEISNSKMVLRHRETKNVICLFCILAIAEIE